MWSSLLRVLVQGGLRCDVTAVVVQIPCTFKMAWLTVRSVVLAAPPHSCEARPCSCRTLAQSYLKTRVVVVEVEVFSLNNNKWTELIATCANQASKHGASEVCELRLLVCQNEVQPSAWQTQKPIQRSIDTS